MKPITKALLITSTIVLLASIAISAILFVFSARQALQAKDSINLAFNALQAKEYDRAFVELSNTTKHLQTAQKLQKPSFWVRYIPPFNSDYIVYEELLSAGVNLTASLDFIANQLVESTISQSLSLDSIDLKTAPAAYLSVHEDIMEAIEHLELAAIEIENLHIELFPASIQSEIRLLQKQLLDADFVQFVENYKPFLEQLPTMLGAEQPHDILVLLQNPHELRPTGGFIGSFGRIRFNKGVLEQFYTEDVYNVDVFALGREEYEAPEPIQKYADVNFWYFRDANWSPDFPTSAKQAIKLYEFETREEGIDTVIAVTPSLIQEFLKFTGPIEVDSIVFDENNLIDAIQHRVEQEFWRIGLTDEQRKTIINDLAQALLQRVFNFSSDQFLEFASISLDVLDRKEILVYTSDPQLQSFIESKEWAGLLRQEKTDFIGVFDANLGALKTDRLVERKHEYTLIQDDNGTWKGRITIRYKNNGFFDYRTTRYRTYTRIYTPLGSELLSSSGFVEEDKSSNYIRPTVYEEFDKTVFAGFVSVEPGQERFATIEYQLPAWLSEKIKRENKYSLLIQKQSGVAPIETTFSIQSQKELFSFAPSAVSYETEANKKLFFTDSPLRDTTYTLKFKP